MDKQPYLLIIIAVLIVGMGIWVAFYFLKVRKKNTQEIMKVKSSNRNRHHWGWLYNFYKNTPGFKKYFLKTKHKVEIIYPSDTFTITEKTTSILVKISAVFIIGLIVTFILGRGDVFFLCAGVLLIYVVVTEVTNRSLFLMEEKLLNQFVSSLKKIRHYFHDTKNIESAIALTLETAPYEISLHLQKIYEIVSSAKPKTKIEEYKGTEPNEYFLMFLSICSTTKDWGDKELEDGQSLFITNIDYLCDRISKEIVNRRKEKYAFSSTSWLALFPVLGIKPLTNFNTSNFPELSEMYKGVYGIVTTVLIFVASFFCYSLIISLRDKNKDIEKEDSIYAKAANNIPVLNGLLNRIIVKKYARYKKYDSAMKGIGDHTGPKAFLLKRIVIMIVVITSTIIISISATVSEKTKLVSDFATTFDQTVVPNEDYRQNMKIAAMDNAGYIKQHGTISSDVLTKKIIAESEVKKEAYAQEIAKEIIQRAVKYERIYYKWFYLIIALLLGVIAYNVPVWVLMCFRKKSIEERKEDEIIQFQNIILILMNMDGITVEEILEWLDRFSYCFREDIEECRISYSSGNIVALKRLKDNVDYEPFTEIVDNMISADRVGIKKAFEQVKTDREYLQEQHEQDRLEAREKNSSIAKFIAMLPLGATVALSLIVPIAVLAKNMLEIFFKSM